MSLEAVLFDMFDTLMMIEHNHAFYEPSLKNAHYFLLSNGINVEFDIFRDSYVRARDSLYTEANPKLEDPHFNLRISRALNYLGYNLEIQSEIVVGATNAFCECFMGYIRIDKNAKRTLKKLRRKFKLGIVSNFAIPECVIRLLKVHGLDKMFDVVIVSGAINKRKPSPEIFQRALEELGVGANNAVFVGDTLDADIAGAKSVGMKTIYIERRPQKELESVDPDQTIKDLHELTIALERL